MSVSEMDVSGNVMIHVHLVDGPMEMKMSLNGVIETMMKNKNGDPALTVGMVAAV